MNFLLLAILGAFSFAISSIMLRKAVLTVEDSTIGVPVAIWLSVVLLFFFLAARGGLGDIGAFSWQGYALLGAAGIIHFVAGRSLNFELTQVVGVNISNVLNRLSPIVAVILGLTILGENLTWQSATGVALIISGLIVISLNPQMLHGRRKFYSNIPRRAYLLGLGVGVAFGVSPVMIKIGLGNSGSPVAGVFISYAAAAIAVSTFFVKDAKRVSLATMSKGAWTFFCLTGLFTLLAQLFRYVALDSGPVSLVATVFSISPIFTLLLAFFFIRKVEVFSTNVIIGIIIVLAGTLLIA